MSVNVARWHNLRPAHPGRVLALSVLFVGCAGVPGKPGSVGEIPWSLQYRPSTPEEAPDSAAAPMVGPARPRILLASNEGTTVNPGSSGQIVQGYNVPGRNPNSQAPWEFFLGNAAHRLIAYMYRVNHPTNRVFYNNKRVIDILADREIGDSSRLLANERNICPDIADISARSVFEIKPWNDRGLQEGRLEVQTYLAALNRGLLVGKRFTGGVDFHGQILVRFAQGQYIWRLEWYTPEPGVTQYRWTRSQQRFESEKAAYEAGQWIDITEQEMRQYGGWVAQAVEGMVTRREQLADFSSAVGVVIDVAGNGAVSFFWGAIFGRMNAGPGVQQPPTQGGGQVLPFPAQPPSPPAQVPAAAMGL